MGFTQCFDLMWIIVYVVVTDNGDYLHWLPGGALMRFYEAISGNALHGLAVGLAGSSLAVGFARIFPWRLKGQRVRWRRRTAKNRSRTTTGITCFGTFFTSSCGWLARPRPRPRRLESGMKTAHFSESSEQNSRPRKWALLKM